MTRRLRRLRQQLEQRRQQRQQQPQQVTAQAAEQQPDHEGDADRGQRLGADARLEFGQLIFGDAGGLVGQRLPPRRSADRPPRPAGASRWRPRCSPRPLIACTTLASLGAQRREIRLERIHDRPVRPRRREMRAPAGPRSPCGFSLDARCRAIARRRAVCGSGATRTMGDWRSARPAAKKSPEGFPLPGISRPR